MPELCLSRNRIRFSIRSHAPLTRNPTPPCRPQRAPRSPRGPCRCARETGDAPSHQPWRRRFANNGRCSRERTFLDCQVSRGGPTGMLTRLGPCTPRCHARKHEMDANWQCGQNFVNYQGRAHRLSPVLQRLSAAKRVAVTTTSLRQTPVFPASPAFMTSSPVDRSDPYSRAVESSSRMFRPERAAWARREGTASVRSPSESGRKARPSRNCARS